MLMIIEFTDADDFMKIVLWLEDIIIEYKFNVINRTVVKVFPVTSLIDAVYPGFCKAYLANPSVPVDECISWAEKAIIMQSNYSGNFIPF